ncbi:mucin-2-like [Apis laboriosa]|uniref:mucin-2-like n=1 Tax=Apis laboriosa TaxID=183418 RepID=UPI001CC72BC3|nr:mucin-2-like [Apis laboriosa]
MGAWMSWLILLQLSSVFAHGYDNVGFDGWYQPVPHRPVDIITDVINDLGVRILQQYTVHGNVAFSPTGVGFVLAALYEGSAGRGRQQIVDALGLPRDRDITRIGFRDIHRRLRTYLNADGFLGGLTLNHENTRLRPEYEDILRFYGFDLSIPEEEMNETTFVPETTNSVMVTEQSTIETKTIIPVEITTQSITTQDMQSSETTSETPISTTSSVELTGITSSTIDEQDKLTQTTPAVTVLTNNPNAATTVSSSIVTSSSIETTTTSSIPTIIMPNLITTSSSEIVTTPFITNTPSSTTPSITSTTPILITTVASTISEEPQTTVANLTQPITTATLSNQSPSTEKSTSTLSTSRSTSTPSTTTITTTTTTSTTSIPSSTSETPLPSTTLIIVETPESTTISTDQTTEESVIMTEPIPESTIMPPITSAPINAGVTVTVSFTEMSATLPVNITEISTNSTIPTTQTNEMSINETSRFTNKPDDENTILVDSLNNQSSVSNEMESTEPVTTTVAGEIGSIGQEKMMSRRKRSDRSPRGFFSSYPDEGIWMQDLGIWKPYSTSLNEASVRDSTEISFLVNGCDVSSVTASRYFAVLPFAYFPSLHAVALEFPLDDPRYNIILMMATDRRDTYRLARDLGGKSLRLLRKQLQATWVRATIPSFMLRGFVTLTSFLQRLGILDVFEPRTADLSPMTPDLGVYARDVQQSIGVNIRNYMKPDRTHSRNGLFERAGPVPFTVVHPFLYFIVDAETSVVLIAGRVNDPLNSRIL